MSNARYSMKYLGKNLVAVSREHSQHDFLAASANLRGPNEIHYLRYNEDTDDLRCLRIYELSPEVLSMSSCTSDPSLVCLVTNNISKGEDGRYSITPQGGIWKMEDLPLDGEDDDDDGQIVEVTRVPLKKLIDISHESVAKDAPGSLDATTDTSDFGNLRHLSWGVNDSIAADSASGLSLLATYSAGVRLWTVRPDGAVIDTNSLSCAHGFRTKLDTDIANSAYVCPATFDPHHTNTVAVGYEGGISFWDTRTGERMKKLFSPIGGQYSASYATSMTLDKARNDTDTTSSTRRDSLTSAADMTVLRDTNAYGVVRTVDWNPNRLWFLLSAGDDGYVKIWDYRMELSPVLMLDGHSAGVTSAAFNPYHDQLIASGGADGRTLLWRASTVSALPLHELDDIISSYDSTDDGPGLNHLQYLSTPKKDSNRNFKLASDMPVTMHQSHGQSVYSLAWSKGTAWVYASMGYAGDVSISVVPPAEKYRVLL